MSKTLETNGQTRKTLASQLDRLDRILDGLSEGLDQAVAQAVREAVGLAVREAVQAVLTELLNNPALREQLQKAVPPEAPPPAERTLDVAGRHGLSPGRVSQLRREFLTDWRRYISEPPAVV